MHATIMQHPIFPLFSKGRERGPKRMGNLDWKLGFPFRAGKMKTVSIEFKNAQFNKYNWLGAIGCIIHLNLVYHIHTGPSDDASRPIWMSSQFIVTLFQFPLHLQLWRRKKKILFLILMNVQIKLNLCWGSFLVMLSARIALMCQFIIP